MDTFSMKQLYWLCCEHRVCEHRVWSTESEGYSIGPAWRRRSVWTRTDWTHESFSRYKRFMSPGHGCTQKHKVTQCVFYLCKFLTSWQQNIAHCTHKNHQINSQQILEVGSTIKKMRRLGRWLSWKSTLLHKCEGLSLFSTMHIINAMCGDRFIIKLQG